MSGINGNAKLSPNSNYAQKIAAIPVNEQVVTEEALQVGATPPVQSTPKYYDKKGKLVKKTSVKLGNGQQ